MTDTTQTVHTHTIDLSKIKACIDQYIPIDRTNYHYMDINRIHNIMMCIFTELGISVPTLEHLRCKMNCFSKQTTAERHACREQCLQLQTVPHDTTTPTDKPTTQPPVRPTTGPYWYPYQYLPTK